MGHLLDKYSRVTEAMPCPKCGRPDWCLVRNDSKVCICSRVQSGKPLGNAGWLHYLPEGEVQPIKREGKRKVYLTTAQVVAYLHSISFERSSPMLSRRAKAIGLSLRSIEPLGARYDPDKAALVFPMVNGSREPCGCRFRRSDGRKWSLKGGREGVFLEVDFTPRRPAFITEGPTDAAALIEAGLPNVIGRPNCSGGSSIVAQLLSGYPRTPAVILADPDEPGIDGATRLANYLQNPCIVLTGPSDLRKFVTGFKLPTDARRAILQGLSDCERPEWKPLYRNKSAEFFNFATCLSEAQAA